MAAAKGGNFMTTPFKSGTEFLVNTTVAADQSEPTITALADGRFIVAWRDASNLTDFDIRAQVFNADGSPFGTEFLVNTTVTNDQNEPSITALADGRFVVAWKDFSQTGVDTSGSAVRAQVFNADGSVFGTEFLVNTTVTNDQFEPSITAPADGRFVVAWTDFSQTGGDTSLYAVRAQVFNADGTSFGAEFLVNTTATNNQHQPSITALADGRFVVAWQDFSQTGGDISGGAIRAQVFNADGSAFGTEFLVNTTVTNSQSEPSITGLADGRFVVAWADFSQTGGDTSNFAVRAQVFNADGSASGAEFLVNTTVTNAQTDSTITALADGRFVVAWKDFSLTGGDLSFNAIRAQVFNADGSRAGTEFLVNTTVALDQKEPSITALADGRFVVAWTDESNLNNTDIRGQIFDPRQAAITLNGTLAADDYLGTIFGDVMRGSFGDDRLNGAAGDDVLAGEWGNDSLTGGAGNDRMTGEDGDDTLLGSNGADILDGGLGNDVLNGGVGADAMIGGAGNDRYVIDSLADLVVEAAGVAAGTDFATSGTLSLNLNAYANVENATLTGAASLSLTGTIFNNLLTGNNGGNVLIGDAGNDRLSGGGGADNLTGGSGNDTLQGGSGTDTLLGGGGADTLIVAAGDISGAEVYDAGIGLDTLLLTSTSLDVTFDLSASTLVGIESLILQYQPAGIGRVILTDTQIFGLTQITGTVGANTDQVRVNLFSLSSVDFSTLPLVNFSDPSDQFEVQGDLSNETITGSVLRNSISGNGGDDTLFGGLARDQLFGGSEFDRLSGGGGNDTLDGGTENDVLTGGAGDDFQFGGDGNDTLNGDSGFDTMFGGNGLDVFALVPGLIADTYTVKDFIDGQDRIDLSAFNFASLVAARAAFVNVGANVVFGSGGAFMVIENLQKVQINAADLIL